MQVRLFDQMLMRQPMSDQGLKKTVIIGASLGAVVTLGAAIAMDYFLSSSLQGTWRDAAVKDVTKMFGPACGQNWFAVTLVLVVVMSFLAGFGAILGAVAGTIMNRFFKLLLK
jgi:membrane protein YqaA with SNARE-associated domain